MKIGDLVHVKPNADGMFADAEFFRILSNTENGNFRGITVPDVYFGREDILALRSEIEPIPEELVNEPIEVIRLYFAL